MSSEATATFALPALVTLVQGIVYLFFDVLAVGAAR